MGDLPSIVSSPNRPIKGSTCNKINQFKRQYNRRACISLDTRSHGCTSFRASPLDLEFLAINRAFIMCEFSSLFCCRTRCKIYKRTFATMNNGHRFDFTKTAKEFPTNQSCHVQKSTNHTVNPFRKPSRPRLS